MREPPCLSGFCWYGPQCGPNITAQAVLNCDLEQKWVSVKIFQMILVSASITQFDFCHSISNLNSQPCPELNNQSIFFATFHNNDSRATSCSETNLIWIRTKICLFFHQLLQLQKVEKLLTTNVSLCQTRILQWRTATMESWGIFLKKILAHNDDLFWMSMDSSSNSFRILTQNLTITLMVDNKEKKLSCCAHFLTGIWSFLPIPGVRQALFCTHSHATKYLIWCETTHSNICNYETILYLIIQLRNTC